MENHRDMTLGEQFAAAQDWWREAGVDFDFTDEVQVMLADEAETAAVAAPAAQAAKVVEDEPAPPKLAKADLPDDLDAFRNWWSGADNPFANGTAVPPRGSAQAQVMVLVPMPEADDGDSLLAGAQGRLVSNMLAAAGVPAEAAYLASALPWHMPLPDWETMHSEGLGTAISHHVELAAPQRVILFGSKMPALFGHDPAAPPESFTRIGNVPVLTTFAPDRLLDHARQRARLWRRLLEWTANA